MSYILRTFGFVIMILFCLGCQQEKKNKTLEISDLGKPGLQYAEGFSIKSFEELQLLTIKNPWPKADKVYKYALVTEKNSNISESDFDGIIQTPVQKIVVTSTTHIPALELLGVEQTLIGFPGTDYVSSQNTRNRIDNGKIRELGSNEGLNTEVLLELRPDVVIAFGVDGTSKSLEVVEKAGIPIIYNGDWVEKTPLAKAEWIKFFGVLYNKEVLAKQIFKDIERNYLEAKAIASKATSKPTILCGAMYKDIWYLPNGTSPEAQFLKDANTNYLWQDTSETGSLSLSFESVFEKAQNADLWLSPSYYTSYDDLEQSNSHYTQFEAFKNKAIYTFSNTTGDTGGVLYYELGISRPDLVLKDMIKICHPQLLKDYETTFFKPLQ